MDEIVCGDCLEEMRAFPAECIDLTVTSPPYDNLRKYHGYTFDFEGIAKELFRVTKPGGVVVWVVGDATIKGSETGTSFKQALYFKEIGFKLHDTMIYHKSDYKPLTHKRYEQAFEYMFIFSKENIKTFNGIKDKNNVCFGQTFRGTYRAEDGSMHLTSGRKSRKLISEYGLRPNVWTIQTTRGMYPSMEYKHPAPFPEQLASDHILSWSNPGDLILDPMCGSGTTCKMAKYHNRHYIGIDISGEYCDIARKRIAAIPARLDRWSTP